MIIIYMISLCVSISSIYSKPTASRPSRIENSADIFNNEASWWIDDDPDTPRRRMNTLASISRSWEEDDSSVLRRVFLKNSSATCNDGSDAGYYLRRFPRSKLWLIYLEGGWYCHDEAYHAASGILSVEPEENPIFWRANVVYIPYCSSDAWTGTRAREAGQKLAFMGSLIIQEVLTQLLAKGLHKGRKLLLAGSSAGATGVLLNIDRVSDLLRKEGTKIKVRGLVDSGWFLDAAPYSKTDCMDPRRCSPASTLRKGIKLWNSELPARCVNNFKHEPWSCFYGSNIYSTLQSKVFVFQWLYDEAQLMATNAFVPRTKSQGLYVQSIREKLIHDLRNVSAVFAPSCVGHVVLNDKQWTSYSVNGVTFGSALRCWWDGTTQISPGIRELYDATASTSKPLCTSKDIRMCKKTSKNQIKLKRGISLLRKRCRCQRSERQSSMRKWEQTQYSPLVVDNQRDKRSVNYSHYKFSWSNISNSCSHRLIDECTLPNCSKQCPRSYDTFSGKSIDFEQMLRNAGVKSSDPINEIFSR